MKSPIILFRHPSLRIVSVPLLAVVLLACAGCGGFAVGDSGSSADNTQVLGSRAVPDGTITVRSENGIHLGEPTAFLIDTSPDYPALTKVEAGWTVGIEAPTVLVVADSAVSANRYRVVLDLPTSIPVGARVFVGLQLADGNRIESGIEDFILP